MNSAVVYESCRKSMTCHVEKVVFEKEMCSTKVSHQQMGERQIFRKYSFEHPVMRFFIIPNGFLNRLRIRIQTAASAITFQRGLRRRR